MWWEHLNPEWRECCNGQLTQESNNDWTGLKLSGVNGFLSIIAGLVGYRDVATMDEWVLITTNVSWVLSKILDICRTDQASDPE